MPRPAYGDYRADCVAYALYDRRPFWLGGHVANSPWTALTWLAVRAEHIADRIDPHAALPLRAWPTDGPEHARALSRPAREAAYSFLVRDGLVVYVLSSSPVPTPVARQSGGTTAGPHGEHAAEEVEEVTVTPRSSDPSAV